jgi:hypothetical protein
MAQGGGEVTFTDDDLKWLKDRLDKEGPYEEYGRDEIYPIIARLEAAEKCAACASAIINDHLGIDSNDERLAREYAEAAAAWGKAAGK